MIHSNAAPPSHRVIVTLARSRVSLLAPSPRLSSLSLASLALGPKAPVPSDLDARPRLDVMAPLSAPGTISKIIVTPSVVLGVCDGCAATRDARATDRSRPEPRRAEAARPPRATRARDTRRSRRANDDARDGVTDRGRVTRDSRYVRRGEAVDKVIARAVGDGVDGRERTRGGRRARVVRDSVSRSRWRVIDGC